MKRWQANQGAISLWVVGLLAAQIPAFGAEIFLFPSVTVSARESAAPELEDKIVPALDLFYNVHSERWTFLAEFVASTAERELERFEVGWRISERDTLWLGRFHSPLGLWNTEYHHADALQPTISRPGWVEFEDDGGPLPAHLTGLCLEGTFEREHDAWDYAVAVAEGPVLEGTLEPFNLLDPASGGRLAAVAKVGWRPLGGRDLSLGGFAGRFDIPVVDGLWQSIRQDLFGLFVSRRGDRGALMAEVYRGSNRLEARQGSASSDFLGGYVQGSLDWRESTFYARLEGGDSVEAGSYLALFENFIKERALAGFRRSLPRDQILKVEVSRLDTVGSPEPFYQVEAQWSFSLGF